MSNVVQSFNLINSFCSDIFNCINYRRCVNDSSVFETKINHLPGSEVVVTYESTVSLHNVDIVERSTIDDYVESRVLLTGFKLFYDIEDRKSLVQRKNFLWGSHRIITDIDEDNRKVTMKLVYNNPDGPIYCNFEEFINQHKNFSYRFALKRVINYEPDLERLCIDYDKLTIEHSRAIPSLVECEVLNRVRKLTVFVNDVKLLCESVDLCGLEDLEFVKFKIHSMKLDYDYIAELMEKLIKKGISVEFSSYEFTVRLFEDNSKIIARCVNAEHEDVIFNECFVDRLLDLAEHIHYEMTLRQLGVMPDIPWNFEFNKLRSITVTVFSRRLTKGKFKLEIKESSRKKSARFIQ